LENYFEPFQGEFVDLFCVADLCVGGGVEFYDLFKFYGVSGWFDWLDVAGGFGCGEDFWVKLFADGFVGSAWEFAALADLLGA
jgi:hypothetical protein